ncbi:sulfatase-like hydrolase/transferase [Salaquimonas pukyongi]|uniref:sulfatase-like hydrolase/transferase n=1 Tax=Salaquimonas pukyongi TaxID=2712698 RepID=UPI00096B70C3|nr:sulfatase-like hydrolase/transferase [Salaquimonas pukyongi]
MTRRNVIVIMTDELRRDALGCYGSPIARTPTIDALAANGLVFDACYTPSPICVPARASIATGRYVHETRCWSNALPYRGKPESWHHRLRDAGFHTVSVGKLHFRGAQDDNGFSQEIEPVYVRDGQGWIHGLLRERDDLFDPSSFAEHIGPGDDPYTDYDEKVCANAVEWITNRGNRKDNNWCMFLSFLRPHYPLTCPPRFYEQFDPEKMPMPIPADPASGAGHPVLEWMRKSCNYDAPFDDAMRRVAIASYHGLCSFVDNMVAQVLTALEASGMAQDTAIIFTSDHGECLGDRGFWTKMVMYEEAVTVPMIIAGAGVKKGRVLQPVSLIDLYPTILELAGVPAEPQTIPHHARSLLKSGVEGDRPVLSEYHDYGAQTAMFMLRQGCWKLVCYPGFPSQLFNLESDPGERRELSGDAEHSGILSNMTETLHTMIDPEAVNRLAFKDQADRIAELGGRDAILNTQNFDHTPAPLA